MLVDVYGLQKVCNEREYTLSEPSAAPVGYDGNLDIPHL